MILVLVWVAVLIAVVVLYLRQIYSRFSRYGVKHFKPVPLMGNMTKLILRMDHFTDSITALYKSFPEERNLALDNRERALYDVLTEARRGLVLPYLWSGWVTSIVKNRKVVPSQILRVTGIETPSEHVKFVGRFEFLNEMVVIRDIELAKKITVKDFDHFLDHRSIFNTSDSFFSRNLFSLQGQEWKDMRSTLSPAFTSSKIRVMVPFMVEVGDQMIGSLQKKIKESETDYIDVDCKDLTTRYANDVIASCAFGLKVDSHNDVENQFYAMGKMSSTFNFREILIMFVLLNAPKVAKFFKLDFMSDITKKFFRELVLDTMKDRELRHIIRPDMIHLLMEAKKGKLTHEDIKSNDTTAGFATVEESSVGQKEINRVWTDDDLIAQAVLFFIAGFETVSSAMSFLLYELALNPDVQERLAQEIKENDAKNGGKFDYNSVQNMTYMDMVVSEVLRLWPPGIALDRICTKDYNLGKPNDKAEKDFILRKGAGVAIPAFAFHRDPQYFPNPEKFDPERFSEENKHNINMFAYMPFGVGPRNCIGSRFALCEVKVMTYQILQHMEVSPCERTCIPAKLSKDTFNIRLEGGHWLRFRARK